MLREAIDRILALSEPHIVEINGEQYADRQMTRVPRELRAEPLEVHTLSALVDYITSGCDDNSDQTDSKSVQQSDDGMSQSVTAKTGIVTSNKVTVPNPVVLRPLSTFSEIVHPQRSFIFRLRGGESGVCAALYAADGNAWKHRAIDSISLYFKNHIPVNLAEDVIVLA